MLVIKIIATLTAPIFIYIFGKHIFFHPRISSNTLRIGRITYPTSFIFLRFNKNKKLKRKVKK